MEDLRVAFLYDCTALLLDPCEERICDRVDADVSADLGDRPLQRPGGVRRRFAARRV